MKKSEGKRREALKPFTNRYIAHRGLFDNTSVPENSLPAFLKAMKEGYAIELDVRLTRDDVLVVFHDDTLERMCGVEKRVRELTYEELRAYSLSGTTEYIPTFKEVLRAIAGAVPVLVEIKAGSDYKQTARQTAARLDGYKGVYAVQSFHPLVLSWFKRQRPWVLRGQLTTDYWCDHISCTVFQKIFRTDLWCNCVTKPDFISFRHTMTRFLLFRIFRQLRHPVLFGWTIRSKEELAEAEKVFDGIIFDSFLPGEK